MDGYPLWLGEARRDERRNGGGAAKERRRGAEEMGLGDGARGWG